MRSGCTNAPTKPPLSPPPKLPSYPAEPPLDPSWFPSVTEPVSKVISPSLSISVVMTSVVSWLSRPCVSRIPGCSASAWSPSMTSAASRVCILARLLCSWTST
ncbi:hypothetical protein DPMN_050958 [Dreissena polymorpha]|uniref:Uncharacterized protein n=1 Tax=Dreissena polymorpha TaxID=45954 RepID=A0A9D4HLR6_DREPO|nr:hypothetical protein DPMN_050958 [Dreissena polymorpha]